MSAKDDFAPINITSPCTADWNSMLGDERIRFCEHCQLSVHNLPQLNSKYIRKLERKSAGSLCVRYFEPNVTRATPARVLHQIGRRASLLAASAFTASLSVSSAVAGDLPVRETLPLHETATVSAFRVNSAVNSEGASITGTIFDPNGAVIPGALIAITNPDSKLAMSVITDDQGAYKFEGLEAGTYNLKFSAHGFATNDVPNVVLRSTDESRIDQTLGIATIEAEVNIISEETKQEVVMVGGAMMALPTNPLVKAAQQDDLDAVKEALLKEDANVRDTTTNSTALEHAVRNANREMVQVLLWARADVNARDNAGQTVLMMLGEQVTSDLLWDLLNAGAKVNLHDNDGDTALTEAAGSNNVEVIKTLLDAGARVNAKNNEGKTALMSAASAGLVNNVKALILGGADLNTRDKQGGTAFMGAKENDHGAVMRLLRSYGVDESEPEKKENADDNDR